ncbi:PHP domain-containing protein [Cohnella sp. AR92]|uniref:PHP domain-containing protein n=1 Tax=Cohnella sp. AR92 TaxID=648716 RepID=UPI000F8F807D|nr:PHP domain-containing protein [Cohnella sp. AR92]RUS48187.1 PHP domain-containing protein [Cohnella sp. AR92]
MNHKMADLHIHSFYSDGTLSPEEIIAIAVEKGLGLIAITDHNALEGSREIQKLNDNNELSLISGVELDASDRGKNLHILGYGMDLSNERFIEFTKKNRLLLESVDERLIVRMQREYKNISLEEYLNYNYDRKNGGWKALHYFVEKGITDSLTAGFAFYSKYEPSYNCIEFPSVSTVCDNIHSAGGKAILAHPGRVIKVTERNDFKRELTRLINLGIDGIECYYPSHSHEVTEDCLSICKELGLLITAGSDCHGSFEKTEIGEMEVPISWLNLGDILSRH